MDASLTMDEAKTEVPLIKSLGAAWLQVVAEHALAYGNQIKAHTRTDAASLVMDATKKRLMAMVALTNTATRAIVVGKHIVVVSRDFGIRVCVLE